MTSTTARLPLPASDSAESQRLIDRQIQRARRQVQWIDLISGLLTLLVGVALFLFTVAFVDHWVYELGTKSRWLALGTLIVGAGGYALRVLSPLILRRINPTYAAWLLERSEPTLKNSLVNFLLLREDRRQVPEAVFRAIEERAAADVAQLPIEATLDHSRPLRWGYIFAAVLAVCAAYQMLSPKDPWKSVRRVLAPWSQLARPSRVQIEEIEPGNAEVFQGQAAVISASIRGLRSDQTAHILYSTADGQTLDRLVPLTNSESLLRMEARIPPDSDGMQQDLRYRLVAGDAQSESFQLRLKAAPLITVTRVELEFPAYLNRPKQVITGTGDIRAPEGTRATVFVKANLPIQSAWIEFDPDTPQSPPSNLHFQIEHNATENHSADTATGGAEKANATTTGAATGPREARQSFLLQWLTDRQQPKNRSYQIRFKTLDEQLSTAPIVHRIDIIPDLAPEVEILVPSAGRADVPADGSQPIEVRALDPDYGLKRLTLRGTLNGAPLFQIPLLDTAAHGNNDESNPGAVRVNQPVVGPIVPSTTFRPQDWKLQPGASVVVVAIAEDNKSIPQQGVIQPNIRQSREVILNITPPTGKPESVKPNSSKPESGKPESGKPESGKPESGKPESGKPESGKPESGKPESGKPESGKPESGKPESGKPESGKPESGKPESGKPESGKPESGKPESGKPESGKPESGKPESGKPESGKPESGKPESGKPESGKPESGKPESGKPESGKPESGKPESGKPTAGDDADVREEPLHDGEVFDQALKYLREKRGGDAGKAGKLDDLQNSARKPEPKAEGGSKPTTPPNELLPGDNAKTGKPGEGAVNASRTEPTTDKPTTDKPFTGQPPKDNPLNGQPTTDKPPRDPPAGKSGTSPQGKPDPSNSKNDEPQLPGSGKPPVEPRDNPGKAFNPDAKPNTQPPVDPQQPRGGTTPPQNPGRPFDGAETPEGDAVNLDYARRATDLVLDYLKDQKDKPDRELLNRLGWTPDELARFVDRWEKMKQAARDENRDVQRDLDETLKSLGLRPAADQRRSVGATSDGQRGNRDAGARSEPPLKYRERFEAYRQGTSRPTPSKP